MRVYQIEKKKWLVSLERVEQANEMETLKKLLEERYKGHEFTITDW